MDREGKKRPSQKIRRSSAQERGQSSGVTSTDRALPPWPRADGTPFFPNRGNRSDPSFMKKDPTYTKRDLVSGWQDFHSVFYDQLLRNKIVPTKFVCPNTLDKLGILEDVNDMIGRLGLGTFAHRSYPLYPEPVRQLLASCEVHAAADPHAPVYAYLFTFMHCGALYTMTVGDVCRIYGFREFAEGRLPSQDGHANSSLWHILADGGFQGRKSKLTHIRNPAIRMVAKIIGSTIFGKEESGSVTKPELELLHHAISQAVPNLYDDRTPPQHTHLDINWGFVFAELLTERRFRGSPNTPLRETIGSLLTPIFRHHRLDLSGTQVDEKIDYMDDKSLTNFTYLKEGNKWRYYSRDWKSYWCKLPAPEITSITSRSNVVFEPHITDPRITGIEHQRPTRRSGSRRQEDYHESPEHAHTQPPSSQAPTATTMEHIIPEYTAEYDIPPFSPNFSDSEKWQWLYETQQRGHSMRRRMWDALRKIKVPIPSCVGDTSGTAAEASMRDTTMEPDVAGHGHGNDDQQLRRYARRRRAPGQNRSVSPDEE